MSLRVQRRHLKGGFAQGSGTTQSHDLLRLLPSGRNDKCSTGHDIVSDLRFWIGNHILRLSYVNLTVTIIF
ncbi:hypothetical protein NIES2098_70560 [Calothrix sp. NIES-2098]|nr:hypothetical protein NIES2098_70560 [Calothrix sp. NIES-2098]